LEAKPEAYLRWECLNGAPLRQGLKILYLADLPGTKVLANLASFTTFPTGRRAVADGVAETGFETGRTESETGFETGRSEPKTGSETGRGESETVLQIRRVEPEICRAVARPFEVAAARPASKSDRRFEQRRQARRGANVIKLFFS
jgi:hypothetical protein